MSRLLSEQESGLRVGTVVKLKRSAQITSGQPSLPQVRMSILGAQSVPAALTFDRAEHNHYYETISYCFKLPGGEELWFEFSDSIQTGERMTLLNSFLEW